MRSIGMRLESRERRYTEKKSDIMRAHAVGDFLKHELPSADQSIEVGIGVRWQFRSRYEIMG